MHNHEAAAWRELFIIHVRQIPPDGHQVAGFGSSGFKTFTPSDLPQKVTPDVLCVGVTAEVKPGSNSHLLGFIATESLGGWGACGCHIESDHQSCVIDRVAPTARDHGPGGLPEYRNAGHCEGPFPHVN